MVNDDHKPFLIRGYRRSDREAVRKLCCDTGFLGDPIDPVYEDRELFADFLTTYYTDHEPDRVFFWRLTAKFAVIFSAHASLCKTSFTRFIKMSGYFSER
jgi:hypothetical protein